jgi:hypothetical protein
MDGACRRARLANRPRIDKPRPPPALRSNRSSRGFDRSSGVALDDDLAPQVGVLVAFGVAFTVAARMLARRWATA